MTAQSSPFIVRARRPFLAVLSSLLLVLAFPPFDLEFLAWVALVPLLISLEGTKPRQAFLLSYVCGFFFFLGTVWWLIHVTLPGMIVVVLYLALYFGLFGLTLALCAGKGAVLDLLCVCASWVTTEYLRSHLLTGFGWGLLGYSQYLTLSVIQIADVTGVWGISFMIVMVNAALAQWYRGCAERREASGRSRTTLTVAAVCLFLVLCYGNFRLKNVFIGEPVRISVIQGNIPQHEKWDAKFKDAIMERYESLTREASGDMPDLIVWPETAVPGILEEDEIALRVSKLAKEIGIPLLAGIIRAEEGNYYNSAVLFSGEGAILGKYDKLHLVPFGEYVPLRGILSFVEKFARAPIGDCSRGREFTVFRLPIERASRDATVVRRKLRNIRFAALICFEDVFPGLVRGFAARGVDFLVNITNDAWYLKTAAPRQHAQASVLRAVEARTNVVRAANTGLSCFIDQKGRITGSVEKDGTEIFVEGFRTQEVLISRTRTPYVKYGDLVAALSAVFTLLSVVGAIRTRRRTRTRLGER